VGSPSVSMPTSTTFQADCVEQMKKMPADSVDSIVCDPPYGLSFMGKEWDSFTDGQAMGEWCRLWAVEAFRVLKPGGHMVAFAGSRTYHRMAQGIEDAGFIIRDQMTWLYGSGFPKSLNVGKAMQAYKTTGSSSPTAQRKTAMGDEYEKTPLAGTPNYGVTGNFNKPETGGGGMTISDPDAQRWQGWGTALKPAHEPIVLAFKPITVGEEE
jgi:DNA modification methylase